MTDRTPCGLGGRTCRRGVLVPGSGDKRRAGTLRDRTISRLLLNRLAAWLSDGPDRHINENAPVKGRRHPSRLRAGDRKAKVNAARSPLGTCQLSHNVIPLANAFIDGVLSESGVTDVCLRNAARWWVIQPNKGRHGRRSVSTTEATPNRTSGPAEYLSRSLAERRDERAQLGGIDARRTSHLALSWSRRWDGMVSGYCTSMDETRHSQAAMAGHASGMRRVLRQALQRHTARSAIGNSQLAVTPPSDCDVRGGEIMWRATSRPAPETALAGAQRRARERDSGGGCKPLHEASSVRKWDPYPVPDERCTGQPLRVSVHLSHPRPNEKRPRNNANH